jgi:hypothetical protein
MSRANSLILLILVLATFVGFDLARTLRTGRARGRFGTITRKQAARFRRYVYGDWIVLAFCVGTILWALISPEAFER